METVNGGPVAVRPSVGVAQGVWKAFGETQALRDVSLDVGAGECHGLVGRNGAGKSTLVAVFTGLIRPDRGVVRLGTEAAPALADRASWQRLVACVYQKSMVVPSLTVAENIFLNRATGNDYGIVNWRAMRSRARQVMLDWGFDLDVNRLARDLTVEQRQVVEIARALSVGARFLILDEPTASLEKAAIERLFERIRRLKESAVGILYISHHLEEIYDVCDRVTVLRDGVGVLSTPVSEIKQDRLVEAMVGVAQERVAEIVSPVQVSASARPRLEISHLHVPATLGPVQDVSFSVSPGECVGLVGRALARHPTVLVAVTPTVGVDVAAKESLLNVIGSARDGGTAVLLVSDDLEDLRICTRLLVMVKGRLVKEYRQSSWNRHELIAAVEDLEPTSSAQGESE